MLRIAMHHLLQARLLQILPVGFFQHPVDSSRQILGIAVVCHISVLLMIDHLRYATYLESYARHAAGHRLHDGIRQILRQGRKHEDIGCIVNIRNALVIAHITERNDRERELAFELLAVSTQYCHAGILPHLGMLLSHQPARLYQIIHALIGIGGSLSDEEDDALVLRQLRAETGFQFVLRTIDMGIYRIGNRLDAMTRQESAQPGFRCQPSAAGNKGKSPTVIHLLLLLPYLSRQIVLSPVSRQILAVAAAIVVMMATQGEMTDR